MNTAASQAHENSEGHRRPVGRNVLATAVNADIVSWQHLELLRELGGHLIGGHGQEEGVNVDAGESLWDHVLYNTTL